jgi:asparagine synthase (glutamine-hydrolysing)
MCSIAGIISLDPNRVVPAVLEKMNGTQQHRGPDGEGYYYQQQHGIHIGFAHRRLAILDLTDQSSQPFRYLNRYVLIFNGEIYNYREIRTELLSKGYAFRSAGDTEVIAAAYDAYGEDCLNHFDGMFAFALWDEKESKLFCARDRFGEKPFYYHFSSEQHTLHFASEIKALFAAGIDRRPDKTMLYNYLTLGNTKRADIPQQSFFENIFQLPPSHHIVFEPRETQPIVSRYWDLDKESSSEMQEKQALEKFRDLLYNSVQRRLRSDVAIGTSLSGGLDSSSIVAIASAVTDTKFTHQGFSAVFPGFEKDESEKINSVARHFDLSVHTVAPTADDFCNSLNELLFFHDEPFGSASVFAQFMVYAKAKEKGVKVLLDGQGADEVLGGYPKYTHWFLQEMIKVNGWQRTNAAAETFKANGFLHHWNWKNRVAAMMPYLTATQLKNKAYRNQSANPYLNKAFVAAAQDKESIFKPVVEKLNDIQYADLMIQGLEELLRYADRNSMAHSCEVRLPFLSHELVQFVVSLPASFRMKSGYTKWMLRTIMEKKLPDQIGWQKGKIGFEPPQQKWMQDDIVQQAIRTSRQKLVDMRVCDSGLLNKPVLSQGAHEAGNFDFRCLAAGLWL